MITYAKVLELGLKHEPIENPENYSWVQIDEEAICGAPLNGRRVEELDFESGCREMADEFVSEVRRRFGEMCSVMICICSDATAKEIENVNMITGSPFHLAEAVIQLGKDHETFRAAEMGIRLKSIFDHLKNDDNEES